MTEVLSKPALGRETLMNASASAGNESTELAVSECSLGEHRRRFGIMKINSFNLLQVLQIISLSYISPRLISTNQAPGHGHL